MEEITALDKTDDFFFLDFDRRKCGSFKLNWQNLVFYVL